MEMDRTSDSTGTYQVALPGEFGPDLLACFAALGVCRSATSSVFLVEVSDELGILAITEMLEARGLEILDIRRVPPAWHSSPGLTRAG